MKNTPLQLARAGQSPGAGAKRIINSQGTVVAYIKGGTLYDISGYLQGGDACGYLDANNNLFDIHGRYVGTVKRGASVNLAVSVVVLLVLLTLLGCSLYYSSYIMGYLGLNVYNPQYPTVVLQEDGRSWEQMDRLDIFGGGADGRTETGYNRNAIIPGSVGTYNFVMTNQSDKAIRYDLKFEDENIYKIPMRYRLMAGNAYIVGDEDTWVTIQELSYTSLVAMSNSSSLFTLEWKWAPDVDDAADTAAGASASSYTLNITLVAELTNIA